MAEIKRITELADIELIDSGGMTRAQSDRNKMELASRLNAQGDAVMFVDFRLLNKAGQPFQVRMKHPKLLVRNWAALQEVVERVQNALAELDRVKVVRK